MSNNMSIKTKSIEAVFGENSDLYKAVQSSNRLDGNSDVIDTKELNQLKNDPFISIDDAVYDLFENLSFSTTTQKESIEMPKGEILSTYVKERSAAELEHLPGQYRELVQELYAYQQDDTLLKYETVEFARREGKSLRNRFGGHTFDIVEKQFRRTDEETNQTEEIYNQNGVRVTARTNVTHRANQGSISSPVRRYTRFLDLEIPQNAIVVAGDPARAELGNQWGYEDDTPEVYRADANGNLSLELKDGLLASKTYRAEIPYQIRVLSEDGLTVLDDIKFNY